MIRPPPRSTRTATHSHYTTRFRSHDIGHPPFGHAGEDALKAAMAAHGGFDHNGHTLRTLARLECPYPLFDGINLTWETLEGLAKHTGPVTAPGWALAEIDRDFGLDLASHASLEAQVAAIRSEAQRLHSSH